MRHRKHQHTLGVKTAHRDALLGNLAAALLTHDRIQTTLAKAKGLRPFIEKIITLAKKAHAVSNPAQKLHYRRLAIARVRDKLAIKTLFDEKVEQFLNRPGGYSRIYKLSPRLGDAANMALIELIEASDQGYKKRGGRRPAKKKRAVATVATAAAPAAEAAAPVQEEAAPEAPQEPEASAPETTPEEPSSESKTEE